MPIACGDTVLTGQNGSVQFAPAGTSACLLDFTDFPAGTAITVPNNSDFRVSDPIVFDEEGTANIDSALTAGTTYFVRSVTTTLGVTKITVSATDGGAAITLQGDGGSGTADTPGAANHISVKLSDFFSICQVNNINMTLTRGSVDTTSLPCGPNAAGRLAPFRTSVAGFASGTGTMAVKFTTDSAAYSNRFLQNAMLKNQEGATIRAFLNTIYAGQVADLVNSLYFEAPISIMGFDFSITTEDSPLMANVNFSVSDQPTNVLGQTN
jgi:hypothetical protein